MSTIRKLTKKADDLKIETEWVSTHAVISAKATPMRDNMPIDIEDNSGWTKVERGVERWMRENRKGIVVKLTVIYKKKGGISIELSDDERDPGKKVFVSAKLLNIDRKIAY